MELKSMKLSKSSREETAKPMALAEPQYPYGLAIRLDNDSLEKLGMSELPKAGKKMKLMAMVEVVGASQHTMKGGKDMKNVELQITSMGLESESEKDASKELYGE